MNELKPCPFCGFPGVLMDGATKSMDMYKVFYVMCTVCYTQGPWIGAASEDKAKNGAGDWWNKRAEEFLESKVKDTPNPPHSPPRGLDNWP